MRHFEVRPARPAERARLLIVALAVAMIAPSIATAGETNFPPPPPPPEPENTDESDSRREELLERDPVSTLDIVERINLAQEVCEMLPTDVRIGCLASSFRRIAEGLPRTGEYGPLRTALLDASRKLGDVTDQYADPAVAPKRYIVPDPDGTGRLRTDPLQGIAPGSEDAAIDAAIAVIDELETVLLRSAENSRQRQVQYQPIAEAVGSTKVLLRST